MKTSTETLRATVTIRLTFAMITIICLRCVDNYLFAQRWRAAFRFFFTHGRAICLDWWDQLISLEFFIFRVWKIYTTLERCFTFTNVLHRNQKHFLRYRQLGNCSLALVKRWTILNTNHTDSEGECVTGLRCTEDMCCGKKTTYSRMQPTQLVALRFWVSFF